MPTFEIVVQRKTNAGWPAVALQTRPGGFLPVRSEGLLSLDLNALDHCPLPFDYGALLGGALFHDDLRDAFTRALTAAREEAQASGESTSLRVLLTIEDPDLRSLHWERLCAPFDGRWDFLSLQQSTPFSLYLPSLTDLRFPPIGRQDLRALLLVAGPSDLAGDYALANFDVPSTVQSVRAALGDIGCDVLASVEGALGPPNLDTLCKRLTEGSYTLLHIACHGQYKDGETRLYLPGDDRRPITATRLVERLNRIHTAGTSRSAGARGLPHFAFLMTCESASAQAENGFGGLAQRLVRDLGMPAVLAMTDPISISTANTFVAAFYAHLCEHGQPDRALGESLSGIMGRMDATVPALFSRLGDRPLFSEALDRPLTPAEINAGLNSLLDLAAARAPILLPELTQLAGTLRGLPSEEGLSPAGRRERAAALVEANQHCEEILDLGFNALALGRPVPPYDARCPFPGLVAFRLEDRAFFFGRDALVKTFVQRLEEHPFLAVLGSSGTGKSSLILAGLLPALGNPPSACFNPGSDPLARLENALKDAPANALVVIDQFEELFTLCTSKDEQKEFIRRLLALVPARRVILTMRADFFGECAPYPALKQALEKHTGLVPPMTPIELRSAIEQQATAVGLRFEAGLAETILDEVQAEPGAMPLLQHALLLLWQRRRGRWLRAVEYNATGRVREAIARTADQIYLSLAEADRERMRAIFLRLTHLEEGSAAESAGAAIEHRDTRRRVVFDELMPAGEERQATVTLVSRLADARLVTTGVNPVSGEEEVEVAHEALIRYWPRLRGWLNEDRAALHLAEGVRDAAQEWEKDTGDESLLIHRAGRLEDALELAGSEGYAFNQLELNYLRACREQQEKARLEQERQRKTRERLRNLVLVISVVAAAVAGALAVWAGISSSNEKKQAKTAVAAQTEAIRQAQTAIVAKTYALNQAATAETLRIGAENQAKISLSRQLAVQASDLMAKSSLLFPRAMLLSIESLKRYPESTANQTLSKGVATYAVLVSTMTHGSYVTSVAFSPDGSRVVSGSGDNTARVWNVATGKEISQMIHEGAVTSVAFSPNGSRVVTGSDDNTARVWEAATGKEISKMVHEGAVTSVAFSPDGRRVVTGSDDNTARVWDVATGREIFRMLHRGPVTAVAFNWDGKWVATGSEDATARVWDATTGREIAHVTHGMYVTSVAFSLYAGWVVSGSGDGTARVWEATTGQEFIRMTYEMYVTSVAFSRDGKWVASGSGDGTARVLEVATGRERARMIHGSEVYSVAFSPDGNRVVSGSEDATAWVWETTTGRKIVHMTHGSYVSSVAFSPNGRQAVSGSDDKTVRVWEAATSEEISRTNHNGIIRSVAFSPDGKWVVTGSDDTAARVWEADTGKEIASITHEDIVNCVAFSPDGSRVVSGSGDNSARVWEAATGKKIARITYRGAVTSAAFSPEGNWVASGSEDATARVWEAATGKEISRITHGGAVTSVAFSRDGSRVVSGSGDSTARVWEAATGKEIARITHNNIVTSVAFSPDGSRAASGSNDKTIKVWEAATGKEIARMIHRGAVTSVAFSPNGDQIVSGSEDGTARVWEAATGREIARITHENAVNSVAFGPDGIRVVSGSDDKTVRVWETTTGREITRMAHEGIVYSVAFHPDGRWVVSGSEDRTARVWLWRPEDLIDLACARIDRNLTQAEWKQYLGEQVPYRQTCPNLPPGE